MTFILSPPPCTASDWAMVMILTMPGHRQLRDRWRQELRGRAGVRLLFLNSATRTAGDQRLLESEAGQEWDILQCGVEDGHRRLGYKVTGLTS